MLTFIENLDWHLGFICGSIVGYTVYICFHIPDMYNYCSCGFCYDGFENGFEKEV